MKKLLGLLASSGMLASTSGTAVSCFGTTDNSVELSTVIKKTDLGKLDNANEATVKEALKKQNSNLNINAIKIEITKKPTQSGEVINYNVKVTSSNTKIYKGEVDGITFNVDKIPAEDLSSVINVKDLGTLDNADKDTVINALQVQNPTLNLDYIDIDIKQTREVITTNYSATVKSTNNDFYTGTAEITFNVKTGSAENLSSVINVKNLGTLDNADEATVRSALQAQNPTLKLDYIDIVIKQTREVITTNYSATVTSNNENFYTETAEITFNVETIVPDELSSVITKTVLTITEIKSANDYLTDVIAANAGLNKDEVTVELTTEPVKGEPGNQETETPEIPAVNGVLKITAKADSTLYTGSVEIALNWAA
ncbi:hypothetical protein [Spiroplasma diminutum]|uniref:Spiralin n=1 Tax=Spiroplasma diminutum CUAS-1 TaxID=1276221 RepID=S5MJG6_9MOLU|nr:hypothetical protein [Spiroplasma diminutum]AGR42120.1 hypothetical protein SDIMI_v3c04160 [Spiroplasma diminutum CUAS-1]